MKNALTNFAKLVHMQTMNTVWSKIADDTLEINVLIHLKFNPGFS